MKRTLWLLIIGALLLPIRGSAQSRFVTFESITFAASSIGFTATTLRPTGEADMRSCTGKLETAQIRIRYDGSAPSTTVGMLIDVGDIITIHGLEYLSNFRGIRTGGTSGAVQFHCSRDQ